MQIANASVNRLDLEVEKIVLNKVVNKVVLRIHSRDVFVVMLLKVIQSLTDAVMGVCGGNIVVACHRKLTDYEHIEGYTIFILKTFRGESVNVS